TIRDEELNCVNEHMVQFPDESISMTVQRNGEETWVSFEYKDDDTSSLHDTQDFNDKEEASLFEPQPNQGIECEESDPIPSAHCTELDDYQYWDSISSVAPANDQEVQEVVNHNDLLHLSDMTDLNVENEPFSTNPSNPCDTCLDHCPELNDDMIRAMDDLLDTTLEFETTQLRLQSELHT
ncbi:hypothetical protein, partial [Cobetia crustatorum]|uniref:hypothetical protein n=1 Tax=Cobetia crustatorum TaxID=553385 RepID=UPI001646EC89